MVAVGVPPVIVGVAKGRFLGLFMRLIADHAATQQVIFVVFCTIIFLSGLFTDKKASRFAVCTYNH
jgi:hypothetical protein